MFLIRRYLDEGAAGGGSSEEGGSGGGESSGGGEGEGGESKGGGGESGGESKGGGSESKSTDKKPDYATLEASLATEKEASAKLTADVDAIKKKMDENSSHVGAARKLIDGKMSKTAQANFAKTYGIEIPGESAVAATGDGVPKLTAEGIQDPEFMAKAMQLNNAMLMKQMGDMFGTAMDAIQEDRMAKKFGDWDGLKADRESVHMSLSTGKMNLHEASHLVAQAQNMPAALKAAGDLAVEEYVKSLEKKSGGAHSRGGGGAGEVGDKKPERESMSDTETANRVLTRLKINRT